MDQEKLYPMEKQPYEKTAGLIGVCSRLVQFYQIIMILYILAKVNPIPSWIKEHPKLHVAYLRFISIPYFIKQVLLSSQKRWVCMFYVNQGFVKGKGFCFKYCDFYFSQKYSQPTKSQNKQSSSPFIKPCLNTLENSLQFFSQ